MKMKHETRAYLCDSAMAMPLISSQPHRRGEFIVVQTTQKNSMSSPCLSLQVGLLYLV